MTRRSIRFKLTNAIISQIKDMPSLSLWLTEENKKVMKDNNLELIIPSPYIREIPKNRDENLREAQKVMKEVRENNHIYPYIL